MLTLIITIILFHFIRLEKLNPRYIFFNISWVYFNIQKIRQETLTGERMDTAVRAPSASQSQETLSSVGAQREPGA